MFSKKKFEQNFNYHGLNEFNPDQSPANKKKTSKREDFDERKGTLNLSLDGNGMKRSTTHVKVDNERLRMNRSMSMHMQNIDNSAFKYYEENDLKE